MNFPSALHQFNQAAQNNRERGMCDVSAVVAQIHFLEWQDKNIAYTIHNMFMFVFVPDIGICDIDNTNLQCNGACFCCKWDAMHRRQSAW